MILENIREILCIMIIDMGSNQRGLRWPAGSFGSRNDSKSTKKENDRKKRIQSKVRHDAPHVYSHRHVRMHETSGKHEKMLKHI